MPGLSLSTGLGLAPFLGGVAGAVVSSDITFGRYTLSGEGASAISGVADGTYGEFAVASNVITPNTSPLTVGTVDVGGVDVIVEDDSQTASTSAEMWLAIVNSGALSHSTLKLRPGDYDFDVKVVGFNDGTAPSTEYPEGPFYYQNNSSNPFTITSQDLTNRARFLDCRASFRNANGFTLKSVDWEIRRTYFDTVSVGAYFASDATFNSGGVIATNILFDDVTFTGPDPALDYLGGDLTDGTTIVGNMSLPTGLNFTGTSSTGIRVKNCRFKNVSYGINLVLNGTTEVTDTSVETYYIDAYRFIAPPSSVRVAGDKLIARISALDCIGLYEEDGNSDIHPDGVQFFNGSGTGQRIDDLVMKQVAINPGALRNDAHQGGFSQVAFRNAVFHECLWTVKASTHGFSLYSPASTGVQISSCTMADHGLSTGAYVRLISQVEPINMYDCIITGEITETSSTGDYELIQSNNQTLAVHSTQFDGPASPATIADLYTTFTPKSGSTAATNNQGALGSDGAWRGRAYRPMMADAPGLTPASTQITVVRAVPSDDGGSTVSSYDLRWRTSSGGAWTEVTGISASQVISGLTNSTEYEVQTAAVNSRGRGLWTESALATPTA